MRIIFTGGGTGGHIFPIVAIIRELKRIAEEELIVNIELFYMGPEDFIKNNTAIEDTFTEEGVIPIYISSSKLRTYFSLKNILDVFKTALAVIKASWNIFLVTPDVVFSKGGYGALPVIIAAAIFRIPIIIHESDAIPGKVNSFSARFAKKIGIAFTHAAAFFPKGKTALVGVPIRKRILGGSPAEAKEHLNIYSQLQVIGVLGGSQGAKKINETILRILREITEQFEIVHQTGAANLEDIKGEAGVILESGHKERYHVYGSLNEEGMRDFFQACDIIISRAGASSIFEIAAWNKPSILIPILNSAQDHQRKNAYEYAAKGAAIVLEEPNLKAHILLDQVKKLATNKELMKKMAQATQTFARIDSAELIAREILKLGVH